MSTVSHQKAMARLFQEMHRASSILVLPNAWDAITARIFMEAGFPAIGTTSAGIAVALGYPDGQQVPLDEMVQAVQRIVRVADVPVTADIESGYGKTSSEIVRNVERFLEVGVVGINIEDTTSFGDATFVSIDEQADIIRGIRALAESHEIPLLINARTDVLGCSGRSRDELLEETILRAQVYQQAGADCIYVFGQHDRDTIQQLVESIEGPLNVLIGPSTPSIKELQEMGVARASIGPGAVKAALQVVKEIAEELRGEGTYATLLHPSLSYQEMNGYFTKNFCES